ncbi:hypothetical protein [Streptomyces albus]|uniref:hypothetical protein n=1 Tax=Streptomyces albus TaxID=1888 RepID=UPI003F1C88E4
MAVDTVPPVPEGPPDPPTPPGASTDPAAPADSGIMAALLAAVEPARPVAAAGAGARPAGDDPAAKADPDVVDRSSPGLTSASFKAPQDLAGSDSDAAGTRYKEGVIKSLIRAGATRWAKGGGTANKRLDLAKARAAAHQVKETRTTTVTKSPGLPSRGSSGGSGGGGRNSGGSSGGNSGRSSSGNGSGAGRSGSGGGSGGGGRGSSGSNGSGGSGGGRGTSGTGTGSASKDSGPKDSKGPKDSGSKGKDGSSGNGGAAGKSGKDGKGGAASSGGGSPSGGSSGGSSGSAKDKAGKDKSAKADLKKSDGQGSGGSSGSGGGSGSSGGPGKHGKGGKDGKDGGSGSGADKSTTESRSPLQRSRETGHGDGTAVRNAFDHVKAYAKGAKDGYQDTKAKNSKEHARLDKAHAQRNATKDAPKGTTVTGPGGRTLVIAPPDEGDDGVSTDVQPLQVQEIDANALTLAGGAQGQVSRKELRNFKQYERKLEAKVTHLVKIADACKALQRAAEDEAKDCQQLADQGKAVEGGEKLAAKLTKLADQAKAQAAEAAELHRRSRRAVDMCKTVLTNIGTRYAPLYKAVVDSDETKPAELRFYTDKGSYAPAA